jgi:hypothetical protein
MSGAMQFNAHDSGKKPRTVLRTIRLPRNLDDVLISEAQNRGLSPNALVSMVMTRFVEWDRFADRFHFVCINTDLLKGFLVQDESLEHLAEARGSKDIKEAMLFWFKEVNVENLLRFLSHRCRYAGYGEFEYQEKQGRCTFAIHHELGPKWSLFLKQYLDAALRKTFHIRAEFETTESSVSASFHV